MSSRFYSSLFKCRRSPAGRRLAEDPDGRDLREPSPHRLQQAPAGSRKLQHRLQRLQQATASPSTGFSSGSSRLQHRLQKAPAGYSKSQHRLQLRLQQDPAQAPAQAPDTRDTNDNGVHPGSKTGVQSSSTCETRHYAKKF